VLVLEARQQGVLDRAGAEAALAEQIRAVTSRTSSR